MGQHVKEIAVLRVDDALRLFELFPPESLLRKSVQDLLPGAGVAPEGGIDVFSAGLTP